MPLAQTITFDRNDAKLFYDDKCDKYDYLIAVACGAIGGLVDVFLVGAPGEEVLGQWTDAQTDNFVKFFARKNGWSPRAGNEDNVGSAIGHLEKKFRVNYDHRHTADVGGAFEMSTRNHHLKSLAHSPDLIGLFFSVLNQFTSTATFVSGGQLITIDTETFELQGGNVVSKVFCGVANWFGHIISDIAGSSGGRGNTSGGRGSGVAIPFYSMLQFATFGEFQIGKDRQDLATLATRAFQDGYDFRHGMAMAIPVILTELLINLSWALKRYYVHQLPLAECIPNSRHASLRLMLIIGHGTLCVIDALDAGLRSGGNALTFFLRLNLIAWFRLVMLVLKEVMIRLGINADMQAHLDSYKRINAELKAHLAELEKLDLELYQKETENYNKVVALFEGAVHDKTINLIVLEIYEQLELEIPWEGDFDEFMMDSSQTLSFKAKK